ncbi:hypothetical protein V2A60_006843 [Cordyceps javanica]
MLEERIRQLPKVPQEAIREAMAAVEKAPGEPDYREIALAFLRKLGPNNDGIPFQWYTEHLESFEILGFKDRDQFEDVIIGTCEDYEAKYGKAG